MERTLRVYYRNFTWQSNHHTQNKVVPEIRLSGIWLENAGFTIGDYIKLRITDNEILIKKMDLRNTESEVGS